MENVDRYEIETLPHGLWKLVSSECIDEIFDEEEGAVLLYDLVLEDDKGNKVLVGYKGSYIPQMIRRLYYSSGKFHTTKIFLPVNYVIKYVDRPLSKLDIIGIDFKEYVNIFHFKDKLGKEYDGTKYACFTTYDEAVKFCIESNKNKTNECLYILNKILEFNNTFL